MKRIIVLTALGATATIIAATFTWSITTLEQQYVQDHRIPVERVAPEDAPADMPRCTDAIADAGGICHGEPLPACQSEDSDDCYWDATMMGNGIGRSFVVEHGVVTFTD